MSTQFIHNIYFTVTNKFSKHSRLSDKYDIISSHYNIMISMKDKNVTKHEDQENFATNALAVFWYYR